MEISILILNLTWIPQKLLNSPSRSAILPDFYNQEYRFTISKSRIRQVEKQEKEEEEEHRQLQSVLLFTQTRKAFMGLIIQYALTFLITTKRYCSFS